MDLRPHDDAEAVRQAIERVIARGRFVLGEEVAAFEAEFASACGARHAVGVASGTDAIALTLRALEIGAGDEVIVPAMTAAYTALAVVAAGARPVIVDVEPDTLTLDVRACEAAISPRTRAVVPVHLYGQGADMQALRALAGRHALAIVEDCCQAHLATEGGTPVGTSGRAGAFSFYPTKNLGALGDGGAIVTNDDALTQQLRVMRNGGQTDRYHHVMAGVNSRLDELQAAVLRVRLGFLPAWTARRRQLAALYRRELPATVAPISERDAGHRETDGGHVYHLFPVRSPDRDALQSHLAAEGIETLIHYPVSLSEQRAFAAFEPRPCPVAERAGRELLSLPLHPWLADGDVLRVARAVDAFRKGRVLA